ncbi:MAG: serine/threonine protein kinase, partial [Pontiella sp.]|nr:serine/threonine protein kinase [Pontiella sp.]
PQHIEQFLREARLTANLAHPNIMPVYNMGLDPKGVPFFSMELIPGDSLKTILSKLREDDEEYGRTYPLETLLNIFMKICDAIAYAHSRNVLHLDIKPDNIRVGEFGEVLVCDWGLARVVNAAEPESPDDAVTLDADVLNDMTLSGTMKGTPGFMAPEQTLAYGEKTFQTDVYALGALLYMLLTFELPVRGASAHEVVQNTREGKVVPPRKRKPDRFIPGSPAAVAMKALALRPEDRYQSAYEMGQEVARYLSGHATEAERAGWITKTSLLLKRHSRVAFLLITFLLLLAVVVSGNLVTISREKAEAIAARKQAEDNFQLYLDEQTVTEALGVELGEAVSFTVRSRDFVNAAAMINLLETGLKEDIDTVQRQNLYAQKGNLHFVLQQFNAARECFESAGNTRRIDRLSELSRKYAEIKPNDRKRLTDQQLADLIRDDMPSRQLTMYYLYYHHLRRRPASARPEEYLPLAGAVLDKLNSSRRALNKPLELTETEDGNHLDLSRTPYRIFSMNIIGIYRRNVLSPLKLSSLDISNSKIESLSELRGLRLDELRMVGVKVSSSKALYRQAQSLQLKRIVLTVDDYPKETIAELKKHMQVVDAGSREGITPAGRAGGGSPE